MVKAVQLSLIWGELSGNLLFHTLEGEGKNDKQTFYPDRELAARPFDSAVGLWR
jgi:hypothetical protein